MSLPGSPRTESCAALRSLLREGGFSAAGAAFSAAGGREPEVVVLHREGCFADDPTLLAEALSCAAFLGALDVLEYVLSTNVPPDGGAGTGLNALHWAANRGRLVAVQRLVRAGAALEARNAYGGTVLGAAVSAAVHEAKPQHPAVLETLLRAGSDVREAAFPSGVAAIDALLAKYGARAA